MDGVDSKIPPLKIGIRPRLWVHLFFLRFQRACLLGPRTWWNGWMKDYFFAGPTIVFTNGCFDALHPGHVALLRQCRKMAGPRGMVVVGLDSDQNVRHLKGPTRPIIPCAIRKGVLEELRCVDHVVVFDDRTKDETLVDLIRRLRPDIIVKGDDYEPEEVIGHEQARIVIVPRVLGFSTTEMAAR